MDEFQLKIKEVIGTPLEKKICDHFEVPQSTLARWVTGAARPYPKIVEQVLDFIKKES